MTQRRGSSGDAEHDMEQRQALLENSLSQLFTAFDAGLEEGLSDPVVFLLDCEDEIGSQFARAWVGDDEVDAALRDQRASDETDETIVTLALAFDFDECQQEVAEYLPYLTATFDEPPPLDGFLAIVVSNGGAGSFTVPFAARPDEAS